MINIVKITISIPEKSSVEMVHFNQSNEQHVQSKPATISIPALF